MDLTPTGMERDTAAPTLGARIHAIAAELYPICRSLAGPGARATLDVVERQIALKRVETPTGTPAHDWATPLEWRVHDAWIRDPSGRVVVDFSDCNLHVLNYSVAFRGRMTLDALRSHIFTLPEQPDLIPYRTSYYEDQWGFCMRYADVEKLPAEGLYDVCIDAEHVVGAMSHGEHLIRGDTDREFVLTTHICHPSLANDNCSGIAVLTELAKTLAGRDLRWSYRFIFAPATIGALAWLARNPEVVDRIDHGLVVSCLGDAGGPNYKRSRRGDAPIDRAMAHVMTGAASTGTIRDFAPEGYDERQFCSPGYDLPFGLLQRSIHATFPQYHTSADNLDFIRPEYLAASHDTILEAIEIIEADYCPLNLSPMGEPQLGRRGLYGPVGGGAQIFDIDAIRWVLNLADGCHSLLDIAERSGLRFRVVAAAAERLRQARLLT
ncbi:DUF4910 domain-containing protein [Sulfitobacter sabulilitoris]|uniref:DUF4910 domain-containing protein n=1 Tax=Sulfitobacter sabulilitoris TaxID=2562655 RepID=A0A5S3PA33_9RHOB|nr:DUF4910 domain-containing protein [Sulfitobacter sabulilitoris]TMM49541.1 DUF4910 domain-containing protein [Sulfitobacter sabulilitoris]